MLILFLFVSSCHIVIRYIRVYVPFEPFYFDSWPIFWPEARWHSVEQLQVSSIQFLSCAFNVHWILLHFCIVRWRVLEGGHILDSILPLYELFVYRTSVYRCVLHFFKDLSENIVIYSTLELRMLFFLMLKCLEHLLLWLYRGFWILKCLNPHKFMKPLNKYTRSCQTSTPSGHRSTTARLHLLLICQVAPRCCAGRSPRPVLHPHGQMWPQWLVTPKEGSDSRPTRRRSSAAWWFTLLSR